MRHHDITRRSHCSFTTRIGEVIDCPYQYGNWTWSKPNKNRRYVQILQYVYDHSKCTRAEIYEAVFGRKFFPGSHSKTFANMLYDDLIDYDKNYKYTITDYGMEILKKSYVADMAKLVS